VGLRKGLPYVLAAARELGAAAQFRAVGAIGVSETARLELAGEIELVGAVPRSELAAHYRWADVFLLPSIVEGSAGVVQEAMSAGLPIVTTPNAGSVVRDGVEGFVVPIRDTPAICERLTRLSESADLVGVMSAQAHERMQEFTLDANGRRLVAALREHLGARE
jgi:glycosyltransferase involved in cell wall biosynthesis